MQEFSERSVQLDTINKGQTFQRFDTNCNKLPAKSCIEPLYASSCANLLAKNNILSNKIGPKPGFNFRQMLRDGRDGLIDLVDGAWQKRPNTKWTINKEK